MASSIAGICNVALSRVGETNFIDSLSDETSTAQVCNVLWDHSRSVVLSSHSWKFATVRASLAALSGVERSGWEYSYALPVGCLTPLYIYPGKRNPASEERIPFEQEDDETVGPILLTDEEDAELVYVRDVENVARWPALFVDVITWKLASELALAIPNKGDLAAGMNAAYERALARAAASDARRGQRDIPLDGESVRAR